MVLGNGGGAEEWFEVSIVCPVTYWFETYRGGTFAEAGGVTNLRSEVFTRNILKYSRSGGEHISSIAKHAIYCTRCILEPVPPAV